MAKNLEHPNTSAKSDTSGAKTIPPSGAATLIESFRIAGAGKTSINAILSSGAMTDFIIAFSTAVPSSQPGNSASGQAINRLVASAGDFAVISDLLNNATAQPQNTTAGNGFFADLDLQGRYVHMDIYAKSTTANTSITVDVATVGANLG